MVHILPHGLLSISRCHFVLSFLLLAASQFTSSPTRPARDKRETSVAAPGSEYAHLGGHAAAEVPSAIA